MYGAQDATATCFQPPRFLLGLLASVIESWIAGKLAAGRKGKVTSIDKSNVLETSRLWRDVTNRVMADEFPRLDVETLLVDAGGLQMGQTQFSITQDSGQQVVEIVRDSACQTPDGFELLCLEELHEVRNFFKDLCTPAELQALLEYLDNPH